MDRLNITYDGLFIIEFLHSGYNFVQQNLIGQSIKIKPDEETRRLFVNHGMDYKFSNGTLVCKMRSRQLAAPAPAPVMSYVEFEGNVRIRFLVFSSSDFLMRTQVIATGSTQVYRFSNQANAGTNGFIAQHETGVNNDDLQNTVAIQPAENCFAVIDIHNNAAANLSYNLFGADKRFLSPVYRIRFVPKP